MAKSSARWASTVSLLRGVLLLIGGVVAMVMPDYALRVAVVVGGAVLLVDGLLGAVASQHYGIEASWPFWLTMVRGGLAALAGVLLLASPLLVGVLSVDTIALLIGIAAIAVGLTELFILIRHRKEFPPAWTSVTSAMIYIAVGVLLIVLPLAGALLLMQIGGGLIAIFGIVEIWRSWGTAGQRLARP